MKSCLYLGLEGEGFEKGREMVDEMKNQETPSTPGNQGMPAQQSGQVNPQPAPQPQAYSAPAYGAPQAPVLTQLSGGMKFAWLVVGLFMGIPGMLLAWLCNVDKLQQVKSDAVKFSVIGFVINIVAIILLYVMVFGAIAAIGTATYSYL